MSPCAGLARGGHLHPGGDLVGQVGHRVPQRGDHRVAHLRVDVLGHSLALSTRAGGSMRPNPTSPVHLSRPSRERSRSTCDAGEGGAARQHPHPPRSAPRPLPRRAGEVYAVPIRGHIPVTRARPGASCELHHNAGPRTSDIVVLVHGFVGLRFRRAARAAWKRHASFDSKEVTRPADQCPATSHILGKRQQNLCKRCKDRHHVPESQPPP